MNVTRILHADAPPELDLICQTMGFVRADIWRRYGGLQTLGKSNLILRAEIAASRYYTSLPVDGTIRNETTKDILNDVLLYKAAAMLKVRQAITRRTDKSAERQRLHELLRGEHWLKEPFLHRQMRRHFRHGRSRVDNQFIVRSDKHTEQMVNGRLQITIQIAKKYGPPVVLTTTSSGKNVCLTGRNLRIIVKDSGAEIHYSASKGNGRPCGSTTLGIDKGYSEAFTDSDGWTHGPEFGRVLTRYSDQMAGTNQRRNKLHALEKKHRQAGRVVKADHIKENNLGRKKLDARRTRTQQYLRTIAFQSAHSVVDKAQVVVSEDLTAIMANRQQWKRFNRRMSIWAKGVLAEALDSVCAQRDARHVLVNAAYTSQMDSLTGLLRGRRVGDKFYRENGDVLQADYNAARNVLARLNDGEVTRYMAYRDVRKVLLARSPAQLSVKGLELGVQARKPSADKSIVVQLCATILEQS